MRYCSAQTTSVVCTRSESYCSRQVVRRPVVRRQAIRAPLFPCVKDTFRLVSHASSEQVAPSSKPPVPTNDLNPEDLVGAAWDPHGLFPPATSISGGHFARRERERKAKLQASQQASSADSQAQSFPQAQPVSLLFPGLPAVNPVAAEHLANGGILASDTHLYDKPALVQKLQQQYMPVDLDFPNLRILHLDPFICTVDSFWSAEQCQSFRENVESSGQLQASKVGAGNVYNTTINAINSRRTSTSMLLDRNMEAAYPALGEAVQQLRSAAWKLLGAEGGKGWGKSGSMPLPKQYCYESLQVARYDSAQYFLSHEDAFPSRQAEANGFQRHATLLVYLNDVQAGGATRFDHLGLAVQPRQGMALLFFPALSDGTPDARTLHTAMDAQDTKWIVQQWIARGWNEPAPANAQNAELLKLVNLQSQGLDEVPARRQKNKRPKAAKKKGFGG